MSDVEQRFKFISCTEASKRVGGMYTVNNIKSAVYRGEIPHFRVSQRGKIAFAVEDFDNWVLAQRVEASPKN